MRYWNGSTFSLSNWGIYMTMLVLLNDKSTFFSSKRFISKWMYWISSPTPFYKKKKSCNCILWWDHITQEKKCICLSACSDTLLDVIAIRSSPRASNYWYKAEVVNGSFSIFSHSDGKILHFVWPCPCICSDWVEPAPHEEHQKLLIRDGSGIVFYQHLCNMSRQHIFWWTFYSLILWELFGCRNMS